VKIGVVSDTHGSLTAWQKALDGPCRDADLILHAGDVLYHGPRNPFPREYKPADLAVAINNCPIPLLIARGNCDTEVDQAVLTVPLQSPYLLVQEGGKRIMVTHGHAASLDEQVRWAARCGVDLLITGHTHVPVLQRFDAILHLNPGSLSLPKQPEPIPTLALIEGEWVKVVELESGREIMSEALK
jgi:putative phosphoesterase